MLRRIPLPWLMASLVVVACAAGCAPAPPDPAPAVQRQTPPPWPAPRDAVSYIDAAGLASLPRGYRPESVHTLRVTVVVDGTAVEVPAGIGEDRVRALEAPVHTHSADGTVWVEDLQADRAGGYTLGQFFTLWGVRFGSGCLGATCSGLTVVVDGAAVSGDPRNVRLTAATAIGVSAGRR